MRILIFRIPNLDIGIACHLELRWINSNCSQDALCPVTAQRDKTNVTAQLNLNLNTTIDHHHPSQTFKVRPGKEEKKRERKERTIQERKD